MYGDEWVKLNLHKILTCFWCQDSMHWLLNPMVMPASPPQEENIDRCNVILLHLAPSTTYRI